jgi:DNA helicase-2/ATP-dependent DNA helicase PcrA
VEGFVRLFILPSDLSDKPGAERVIANQMAAITGDLKWNDPKAIKTLTLEHRMAAARMGFLDIFNPLYEVDSWRTSFLEGTLPMVHFFSDQVLPLVKARRAEDRFAVARLAKTFSPLISTEALRDAKNKQEQLRLVSAAIDELVALWKEDTDPSILKVLRAVAKRRLLEIPEALQIHASESVNGTERRVAAADEYDDRQSERDVAIEKFVAAPFSQVEPLSEYLSGRAHFDTHQGVKGLEFDRVMVIMDDADARGFMFKYEDLFGGKATGEKSSEATRRLFYVTCSRAKQSLALVAYASSSDRVRQFVLGQGWFQDNEVIMGVTET